MAGRKSIIASEESAPSSPLRRSSRISTSSATAPIIGRRSSATAVETAPPAKLVKGKRLSLSQDIIEERSSTPKRTLKTTRAASKSPTSIAENESKAVGTPAKRGRRTSITKTEEDKTKSTTPSTVAGRRRSVRGQSTSPTSDKPEPVKPRGRRISVTEKIAPLVPIEESEEIKKPATRGRRTSLTSRRTSVEESNVDSSLDKRVLTVQLTQLDVEVKKTPRGRGRPSKVAVEDIDQKKTKNQELNPIIETSFTEESEINVLTPVKESPNKSRSKSPKKAVSAEKNSPETPVKGSPKKSIINSPKKLLDTEVEEENFDLLVEDEVMKEQNVDESNSKIEDKIPKETIEVEETVLLSKKDLNEMKLTKESMKSPINELNNGKDIKTQTIIRDIERSNEEGTMEADKPHEELNKVNENDLLKTSEDTSENIDIVGVPKDMSESPEKSSRNAKLLKSFSETVNVLSPNSEKLKSVISENLNKSKLKDDSSFKSPKTAKKKNDDSFLVNPLEMSLGSDGSFHLHLSIPESNNSQEKNESKLDNEKLNTTSGSDNSDKENLASPLNSAKKSVKTANEISVFSVHSIEDKMNTSTPKINLNSSKSKSFNDNNVEIEDSNLDSSISKSINEHVISSTRKSLTKVSKLMEEEEEFCSSPIKKIKPVKPKDEDKSLMEDILDSFVDEVNDVEDLNEEEISKMLESPPNTNKKNQTCLSPEKDEMKTSEVTKIVDVETAVAIIKESPRTKRLSLKLKHSSEESLFKETDDDLGNNEFKSCLNDEVHGTNDEIMDVSNNIEACETVQSPTSKNRDSITNVKYVVETCEISEESSPVKTKDIQKTPATTSSKKKKRMSKKIEESSDNSFTEFNENNDIKMKTLSPKIDKSSIEESKDLSEMKSTEKPISPKRSPVVENKLNNETVVVIDDDDDIKVNKTPKRKSLKLKSSTEDLTKTDQEIVSKSDECSNDCKHCKSAKKSKKEKRRSKKLLEKELQSNKNPDEVIEINEDSSENQNIVESGNINDEEKVEIQEESNDVEFVNEKVVQQEIDVSDDVQFVKNISPDKKSKKDKRKSMSLEIAENITDDQSNQAVSEMITKTLENNDLEQPHIESATIDMVSEESNDLEIVNEEVASDKSPIKFNKGSKRIKRDTEPVSDDTIATKTEDPGSNKMAKKEKRKSQKQNSEENTFEVEEIFEQTQSAKKKRKSVKKQESAEKEGSQENPIEEAEVYKETESSKRMRKSLKKQGSEEKQGSDENPIDEIENICKETVSGKKKRKSLKKQESEEKEIAAIHVEISEVKIDTTIQKSPAKQSPVLETKRSKRIKISHEDENMESSNVDLGVKISPVKSNAITESIDNSPKKTPKKEKRRSKKQQIEKDLFGDDPVNKEEIVDTESPIKFNETKQKTEDSRVKKTDETNFNNDNSSEDERIDSTINDLITEKLEIEDTELENDDIDDDIVPSCDFLDEEAMEGSPESSPSHSNEIVDEGESLHSSDTEEESDLCDEEDYENDSFIDDDECGDLLSGNEYDLSNEKIKKKKGSEKTKKKSRIIVVSDSEDDAESKSDEKSEVKEAKAIASENKEVISEAESHDVISEENKKINIIQNIVISPQIQKTKDDNEETENNVEEVEPKTKVETKLLTDTPNNSFADTTISSTKRNKSKRKTSISIQEKLSLTNSTDIEINEKISKAVDFFCSSIKDKTGNVSLNVSLDYANNSNSSEDAEEKGSNKRKMQEKNIQEVVPSISASRSDENVLKSKKRHSLQDQFTILSETPEIKRRRSVLPEFTISENINKNKRKSIEPFDISENKKTKIVEEIKKSKMPLAEADSVHEMKVKKSKKTNQPGTNVQYLPEDVLVAVTNSSPKVSSSEISESKNINIIKKKKVRIAPSVKMNQHADWEIDEVKTRPSKKNKKSEQQKLNNKLRQLTETFPSNDFKNRTLYNPKRNRRQDSKQILAKKRF